MFDFEAMHVIEALRSGIPSRAAGQYFSEARPGIMKELTKQLDAVCDTGKSGGIVLAGKYGEGKTHLLNTVFNLAHSNNMVVSYLSLSKEAPFDKLPLLYQKLAANTFIPKRLQPGFVQELENMTAHNLQATEMQVYAVKQLETDKLYYLLRSYLNTEDQDEKFQLLADIEGDFIGNALLKQIYKRIFNEKVKYNTNFTKTKHSADYFYFLSHLFLQLGYHGWVILIDETELIGRLSKKARLNAYRNMARFLFPDHRLEAVYTMFALGASYVEDVVDSKHEYENLADLFPEEAYPEEHKAMKATLDAIVGARQLLPLDRDEIHGILKKVRDFHGRAYQWTPNVDIDTIAGVSEAGGYLLRTKIRAAIEFLDQTYQYGTAGDTRIEALRGESFEEDVVSLAEEL